MIPDTVTTNFKSEALTDEHLRLEAPSIRLGFNQRDSWDKLRASGEGLLGRFVSEEFPKPGQITAIEKPFTLAIMSLDLPFMGIIDLVAAVNGKRTVVDWKTAGSAPGRHVRPVDRLQAGGAGDGAVGPLRPGEDQGTAD